MYQLCNIIYFSPTHTSQKVAHAIAKGLSSASVLGNESSENQIKVHEYDLTTDFSTEIVEISNAICVIAVPVYGGRIAPLALQRLQRFKAQNCPTILTVVYGNRDYEDALLELRDEASALGFSALSGGAFIGEHTFSRSYIPVAEGRPDANDLNTAVDFGVQSLRKLEKLLAKDTMVAHLPFLDVPGQKPYKAFSPSMPVAPTTNDKCVGCGICADVCPTEAITMNNDTDRPETEVGKCIKCCACVKSCPNDARIFDIIPPIQAFLKEKCSKIKREPELFI